MKVQIPFAELKQRSVCKVAIAYAVVAYIGNAICERKIDGVTGG
jgi:hypothetical protein